MATVISRNSWCSIYRAAHLTYVTLDGSQPLKKCQAIQIKATNIYVSLIPLETVWKTHSQIDNRIVWFTYSTGIEKTPSHSQIPRARAKSHLPQNQQSWSPIWTGQVFNTADLLYIKVHNRPKDDFEMHDKIGITAIYFLSHQQELHTSHSRGTKRPTSWPYC